MKGASWASSARHMRRSGLSVGSNSLKVKMLNKACPDVLDVHIDRLLRYHLARRLRLDVEFRILLAVLLVLPRIEERLSVAIGQERRDGEEVGERCGKGEGVEAVRDCQLQLVKRRRRG